ncbi:hypothetical protein C4J96_0345 [Pseudomonas orientalis]|nr:hypothetical protein C4J96_0345 [Pseudomonas orientalis]
MRSRVLRTHLYLYVQAYAIERPTLCGSGLDFLHSAWEPWKLRLPGLMKFLTKEFTTETCSHGSMALRHAGAFGNKLVRNLETDLLNNTEPNVGGGLPPIAMGQLPIS